MMPGVQHVRSISGYLAFQQVFRSGPGPEGSDDMVTAVKTEAADAATLDSEVAGGCTYCGLPVGGEDVSGTSNVYCCYGCKFAHAIVQEQGNEGAIRWTVIRLGLAIFFTMNLMAFTMTMWSLDVYDVDSTPFQTTLFELFRWLSMLFALPVLLLLGIPLLQNAIISWRNRVYSTDLLIGLAVVAAYLTSVVNVVRESGTIYFEVGAMVLVMITLGRWIEATGKQKATEALDGLLTLLPDSVTRIVSRAGSNDETVPSIEISVADRLRIRAGERFPTDAVITDGRTTVDEQVFTGESLPIPKDTGDSVLAGTVNLDGDIIVEATSLFRQGSFGRLMLLLQEARSARGYYQRMADRAAAFFFPIISLVAVATFFLHLNSGVAVAIQTMMSVLLIACPCALGLATPLAVWTALSTAVQHQVLFRSGEALERLADAKAVCLDKTGTLTTGQPRVFQKAVFGELPEQESMRIARQLAATSSHPFSKAVAEFVQAAEFPSVTNQTSVCRDIRTVSGGGVEAVSEDGQMLRLGSLEFACCETHGTKHEPADESNNLCISCPGAVALPLRIQLDRLRMAADQQAASIVILAVGGQPAIGFLISETVRPEAESALHELSETVRTLRVLSGDRPAKGRFLRTHLKMPDLHVACDLTPELKVSSVRETRQRHGTTVMVGDGINDAPALAASDVGIAMGCGADVSRDSAQVCLMSNDLTRIPWAIRLAQQTRGIIRQNLIWAFGYNAVGVVLAASGLLNPAIAAGLMIGSSLLVIANSLRLLRFNAPAADNDQSVSPPRPASTLEQQIRNEYDTLQEVVV